MSRGQGGGAAVLCSNNATFYNYLNGAAERSGEVRALPLPREQHAHHRDHGQLHRPDGLQPAYAPSHPGTDKFYLEDKLSESEMRELKEAAIKKIFAKESLEMKVISMQISTRPATQTTTPSSSRPSSRSRPRRRTRPSLRASTPTRSSTTRSRTPRTSRGSASSTRRSTTTCSSRTRPSPTSPASTTTRTRSRRKSPPPSKASSPAPPSPPSSPSAPPKSSSSSLSCPTW